jgi:hypothetical protein
MKKQLIALTFALGLGTAGAFAGEEMMGSKNPIAPKNPIVPAAPCYSAGEWVLKPFFDITIIDSADEGHYSGDTLYGGGLAVDYFFTEMLGIGLDGYWIDSHSVVHSYNINLTARTTVLTDCLSAYAIGGGGVFTNGSTVGSAHIGGGLEYRFSPVCGVFADARYKWLDGGDTTLTSVRIGMSFVF